MAIKVQQIKNARSMLNSLYSDDSNKRPCKMGEILRGCNTILFTVFLIYNHMSSNIPLIFQPILYEASNNSSHRISPNQNQVSYS